MLKEGNHFYVEFIKSIYTNILVFYTYNTVQSETQRDK